MGLSVCGCVCLCGCVCEWVCLCVGVFVCVGVCEWVIFMRQSRGVYEADSRLKKEIMLESNESGVNILAKIPYFFLVF